MGGAELADAERHAHWMALAAGASDIQQLLRPGGHTALVRLLGTMAVPNNLDRLTVTLLRDIKTVLISDMLVKIDRTSMDTALEVRSPFLDHRVLQASLAIGGRQKIVTVYLHFRPANCIPHLTGGHDEMSQYLYNLISFRI